MMTPQISTFWTCMNHAPDRQESMTGSLEALANQRSR
jgi:hypothetical protein